jgi:hypothetical protein
MASASSSLAVAIVLCAGILSGTVLGDGVPLLDRFRAWQVTYHRTYATPAEFQRRFEVYSGNVEFIDSTNRLALSYELGENQFADLTNDEFRATYTMPPREVPECPTTAAAASRTRPPPRSPTAWTGGPRAR